MRRAVQLELPLPLAREDQVRAMLGRGFYCAHLRATIQRGRCHAAQLSVAPRARGAARPTAERAPVTGGAKWGASRGADYCRSGECAQGLRILLEDGLVERAACPTCAGCGWVPRARLALDARASGDVR